MDSYLYYYRHRESEPRYPSIITDYAYLGVARRVAQVTVSATWWLSQIKTFAINFRSIYYAYI